MMNTIVKEKLISFKELEQKVFKYVCELGCEITRIILESYDDEIAASRDTKQYRDKGGFKELNIHKIFAVGRVYEVDVDNS